MANKTALQLLPYLQPSQAQKHVTYNSAIQLLDVLVQTSAISRSLTTPPVSPLAGDCYIVAVGASGDWLGEDKAVAVYNGSYWDFYLPKTGWRVWLQSATTTVGEALWSCSVTSVVIDDDNAPRWREIGRRLGRAILLVEKDERIVRHIH